MSDSRAANQWFKWGRRFVLFSTLALLALGSAAAQARVIYVNGRLPANPIPDGSTWATAWGTIGAALQEAGDGDEVWVAQGTYKEFVTLTNGVALYGGFAGTETDRDRSFTGWRL